MRPLKITHPGRASSGAAARPQLSISEINRYVSNLPPMPGVFPDYPAPVIRNTDCLG